MYYLYVLKTVKFIYLFTIFFWILKEVLCVCVCVQKN